MKKLYLLFCLLCYSGLMQAQSTETFETENGGSTSFTDNGQTFNITSQAQGPFEVQSNYAGTGWNGTSADNRYIDNDGSAAFNSPVQFTISTANGAGFTLKSLWLFLASSNLVLNPGGSMTITGKLGGVNKFQVSGSSFNSNINVNKGFTFIDMTSYGGQNNSNVSIDQYVITTTGNIGYVALDAMTWAGACLAPTVTPVSQTNIACYGGSTGAATISASGSGLTYNWSPGNPAGDGTSTVTGLTTGVWSCTVTNGCGQSSSISFTITQPSAPVTATQSQTNVSCNGGSNGVATVVASGGVPGYTYSWSPSGGTNATASNLLAGNYTVTITDANGCSIQKNFSISQPAALSATQGQTNVSCNGGANGAASVLVSGGTGGYFYSWSPSGGTGATATNLVAGNYTVTITDANSCSIQKNFQITQLSALSGATAQNDVSCFGGSNGTATVAVSGGAGGYTYSWAPYGGTNPTATGLLAGNYTVTVTDANSCQITKNFTINQPSAPVSGSKVIYNVSCFGGNNGAINLTPSGGTWPYTFNWGGGVTTEDRTGLAAGNYSVTITDNNGCTGTVAVTVGQPAGPVSGTTVVTNTACFGGSTGSINLTPSGGTAPYTFNWGGGIQTEDRTGLAAGSYTVTITDINGCNASVNATVGQPSAPVSGTTVVTNVSCFGGSNGAINLTPSGGTAPYTFNWGGGITTEDRTGLLAGDYTVIITDNNGCTATATATISQPSAPVSGSTVVYNVSCYGGSNGAINLTPSGGTGPYTFNWGSGIYTEDRTGLSAGDYTVIVTDNNGCTGTITATVSQPASPVSGSVVVTNVACFGGSGGSIDLTPSGGTGPYTFNWGGGIFTEDRSDLTAGDYSVTITDNYGCTGTVTLTVAQPGSVVSVSADVTNVSCFGGSNGTINLTPSGGTGPYTYDWGSGITTESRTGLQAGNYAVVITSITGCASTLSITVTQPTSAVSGTVEVANVQCYGGSNGSINLTPIGGTAPYTYNWGGGITTQDRTGLVAGAYTAIITDANGCTGTVNITVGGPLSPLSASAVVTNVSCFGNTDGAINITVSGGTGPYGFYWLGNVFTQNRTGLLPGNYTVFILDSNGCVEAVTATVAQPDPLSANTAVTNVSCFGESDGAVDITLSGGTAPYTFNWSDGTTTEDRTGLTPGTYSAAITDIKGCMTTVSITITEPSELIVATSAQTNINCYGQSDGSATVGVTGGTGAYTYSWSPSGGTGATESVLAEGNNVVTITDENGCQITQSFTITWEAIPTYREVCSGATVADVTNEEPNLNWYATATGGTPLAATTKLITGTYYVAKIGCPASSRIATNLVVTCTTVAPVLCGTTLATISSDVTATRVPAATAYRFMVSDGTNTEVVETTLNKFRLTNLAIGSYNTTYTVEVAILLGGEWRDYGLPCTISTGEPLTTQVLDVYCNAVVSSTTSIWTKPVPFATMYRFRVSHGDIEEILEIPAASFKLSMLQSYTHDTSYTIDVAAMINGSFIDYGNSCSVSVPAASTRINDSLCNTNVTASQTISAYPVMFGTQYRFRIDNGITSTVMDRPVNSLKLSSLPGFTYGTSYTIAVAVMIDGVFTAYGTECTVHVPAASTSLEAAYCGAEVSPTTSIYASIVPLATKFRFRVSDGISTSTIDRTSRYLKLNMLNDYDYSTTYTIDVAVMVNGVFSDYGAACQVTTTSSTARFAQDDADNAESEVISQEVSAFPNPYSDIFTISLETTSLEKVTIQVFEITGKLVENLSVTPEELKFLKIGNSYASGLYNVIVTQGSYHKSLKMVKN